MSRCVIAHHSLLVTGLSSILSFLSHPLYHQNDLSSTIITLFLYNFQSVLTKSIQSNSFSHLMISFGFSWNSHSTCPVNSKIQPKHYLRNGQSILSHSSTAFYVPGTFVGMNFLLITTQATATFSRYRSNFSSESLESWAALLWAISWTKLITVTSHYVPMMSFRSLPLIGLWGPQDELNLM